MHGCARTLTCSRQLPPTCDATEMYSPQAMLSAPATSPAMPDRSMALCVIEPAPTPSISADTDTRPARGQQLGGSGATCAERLGAVCAAPRPQQLARRPVSCLGSCLGAATNCQELTARSLLHARLIGRQSAPTIGCAEDERAQHGGALAEVHVLALLAGDEQLRICNLKLLIVVGLDCELCSLAAGGPAGAYHGSRLSPRGSSQSWQEPRGPQRARIEAARDQGRRLTCELGCPCGVCHAI